MEEGRKGGHDRVEIKLTSKCFINILKLRDVLWPDGEMILENSKGVRTRHQMYHN